MKGFYQVGNRVRLKGSFLDVDSQLNTDLPPVTVTVTKPDATQTVYNETSMQRPGLGTYQIDIIPDQAGSWTYKWSGASGQATAAAVFQVFS